jgi:hypothetical protein
VNRFPWLVNPEELFTLRGHGGQTFADFVSALLRAEGAASGVNPGDIQTNTRVNVPDGGVDAVVQVPLGGPLEITAPTCWQFKATEFTEVSEAELRREANKPEARRLIEAGHIYYVCVCGSAPSVKMNTLDAQLLEIVRAINASAPLPRVFNAGHLANWASRHPAIVLQFFRQHLGQALAYEPWLRKERAALPHFVELSSRAKAVELLRKHVAVERPSRPVLTIAGPSGAGVSRLVAEALSTVAPRIVFVPDPRAAVALTTSLVNHPTTTAVLVLDRCGVRVRMAIEDLVKAEVTRLRVVAIQDPTEAASELGIVLRPLETLDVLKVIEANFEKIPSSHRRAFVHFADGILKVAVSLAASYSSDRGQFLPESTSWAHDELRRLVVDEKDREVLRALSLFKRVGYNGEIASQLEAVCDILGLVPKDVVRRCSRLMATPGVAAVGSRYLSVRPRLFASPLFEAAWAEMVGEDVAAFIDRLPSVLKAAFLRQAAMHAPKAAREALADWAIPWVRAQVPADLGRVEVLHLLLPLVEVCPTLIGPAFSDLVVRMSDEEARAPGQRVDWPARDHVVWALRDLLERRDTYSFAEAALFRLARAEGKPAGVHRVGTATEKWSKSFRLYLSGTEVSFKERLAVLTAKLDALGSEAIPLVVMALGFALDNHASKTEGLPIVAGELRRLDWQPRTYDELWQSLDEAILLLGRCMLDSTHEGLAFQALLKHGRGLLLGGRMEALRSVVDGLALTEKQRVAVLGFVDEFLAFDRSHNENGNEQHPAEYIKNVEAWHESLRRQDLSGRLHEAISSSPSFRREVESDSAWLKEFDGLARELLEAQHILVPLIPSFVSGDYHDGALFELGRCLGKQDATGGLLPLVFSNAKHVANPLFVRGYVVGVAELGELHDSVVREELDRLEEVDPSMAVDLNERNLRIGSATARAIRLVRAGRLGGERLTCVWSLRVQGELLADALEAILDTMADRAEDAAAAALKVIASLAWAPKRAVPDDDRTLSAIWRVLEVGLNGAHAEAHTWGRVLGRLSEQHLGKAIQIASRAAVRGEFSVQVEAATELAAYVARDPNLVLQILGPILLSSKDSWRFSVRRVGAFVNDLPIEGLKRWVSDNGVEAARIIACHMPPPYIDASGNATVPPLTTFVFENFEDDELVYSNFRSGIHNGQTYFGDIVGQNEGEASVAEIFRTHPLRRIREWADDERRSALANAQWWREHNEETFDS